jgi:hypothetical protein
MFVILIYMNIIENQILDYLKKNYSVKNFRFLHEVNKEYEFGVNIVDSNCLIFDIDFATSENTFVKWAEMFDFNRKHLDWLTAYLPRKLKTKLGVELAQDLSWHSSFEVESFNVVLDMLMLELNTKIFEDLRPQIKTPEELLSIMRCIGYGLTATYYNPDNFSPYKSFISLPFTEVLHERQINHNWQNWVRTN